MAIKRKRRISPSTKESAASEQLKRIKQASNEYSAWGWVGTEVMDANDIRTEHVYATCGLTIKNFLRACPNIHNSASRTPATQRKEKDEENREEDADVIVISDDEPPPCSKKLCKDNPHCLNYLGQQEWSDTGAVRELFFKHSKVGDNPVLDTRDPTLPVGLRNLGATCYANAFLQVWFRDLAFRSGVYQCQPSPDAAHHFENSPIFQLQVTFAALQESAQSVFSPAKLVESLQLRTGEQQDAQEFSKLFLSHLDAEFQRQPDPSLRSLIVNQFQGKQVYGTVCLNGACRNRSVQATDFLEIEIKVENNSNLEDQIAALLQPEKLTDDNRYLCPRCESLQDALRYTELQELPPILHFSLLRFVYDFDSMERKKSKHMISFPMSLDMGRFLYTASSGEVEAKRDNNVYELRGVLLHKGTSAYHGHYEAQVFDTTNQAWYQFNDETVTKIRSPGRKVNSKNPVTNPDDEKDGERPAGSQGHKQTANSRKKRRVTDSDDELEIITPPSSLPKEQLLSSSERVSSKDAYMLIYSRVASSSSSQASPAPPNVPIPPARALNLVTELNASHEEACERFGKRSEEVEHLFGATRRKVEDIFRSWDPSVHEKYVLVSRQALENWLCEKSIASALRHHHVGGEQRTDTNTDLNESNGFSAPPLPLESIDAGHILCEHGALDPLKAYDMKRISEAACRRIESETHCEFQPVLSPSMICKHCVKCLVIERLYQIEHPRLVSELDRLCEVEDGFDYWISKPWLKDWRLVKPKMHVVSQGDPPPDSPDFDQHVRCEHGNLTLITTTRRRIPEKAYELLKDLYPSWQALRSDAEPCPICEALIHVSKEDKREIRRMVEEEKARLKHMHDNALNGNTLLLENVPCAVVPAQFVRSWLRWLSRPSEYARPDAIDNSPFLCSHDLLTFDPNDPTDFDGSAAVVTRSDWDTLEKLYPCGPLIGLEKSTLGIDHLGALRYIHDLPVCADCRQQRKSDYEVTDITVRLVRSTDAVDQPAPIPVPLIPMNGGQTSILAYGSRNAGGMRQSRRLQQRGYGARRKFTVSKQTTVMEIKIMLQDQLNIPIICQRLFYRGQELEDNTSTVTSLGVLANDVFDLREDSEVDGVIGPEDEGTSGKSKPREEERGFGGTLLGQLPNISREATLPILHERSCSACTYSNPADVALCGMCYTPFA